jgi:lipid A ethanolaminephosphotransferase
MENINRRARDNAGAARSLSALAPFMAGARALWRARPAVPGLVLVTLANLWLLAAYSNAFWLRAYDLFGAQPALLVQFAIAIWAVTMVYVLMFTNRWLLKPFLIVNILIAAGASYYHETMGIIIDREMVQNILGTTANESKGLMTFAYIRHMAIFAVLPSFIIVAVRVTHPPFLKSAVRHVAVLLLCVGVFAGAGYSNYQVFSFKVKQSPGMRQILHPESTVQSILKYAEMTMRARSLEFQQVALDAHKGPIARNLTRPTLTVLVIGETLRDQNWGLSGYDRDTTPELAKRDVLAFGGVESCGTSTSVSIPCMFSRMDRQAFSFEKAGAEENLLDILMRTGYDVEWLDSNTGDMGVAKRVAYANYNRADDAEFCTAGECNDGILLKQLRERARSITRDTVIVLHQIGNHGPAYFERYPESFAKFLPDCRDADLANCAPEHVVNAYDNAVAYTDLQLANTIDFLTGLDDLDTSLIYISDHGESLGENGLYLHAAPYWIAPEQQTRVPMVVWMSDTFKQGLELDYGCVGAPTDAPLSQDHFFHSILGMLDVQTTEHDADLDIFAPCRAMRQIALQ